MAVYAIGARSDGARVPRLERDHRAVGAIFDIRLKRTEVRLRPAISVRLRAMLCPVAAVWTDLFAPLILTVAAATFC